MRTTSLIAEMKHIFSNRKILIPIFAVAFVPVLYAGMFLWAFWDPYAQMDDLPVAVVNQDRGAEYEGKELQLGKELVDNLMESDSFKFSDVSKEEGYQGLKNQDYYLVVEIPENFSTNATTLLDQQPQKLKIKYIPNEASNFLSGQIGETAMKEIKAEISKKITATYAETMFDNLKEMANGLDQASEGAAQINEGTSKLFEGSHTLRENLEVLASKSIEFNEGVHSATAGANDLAKGTNALSDGLGEINFKLPELINGTRELQAGVEQMKEQITKEIADGITEQLGESVIQLNNGADQFRAQLGVGLSEELTNRIASGLSEQLANHLITEQATQMQELTQTLLANGVPTETITQITQQLQQYAPTEEQLQQQLQQQLTSELKPQVTQGITAGLNQGFTQFKSQLNQQLMGSTNGLEGHLKAQTDPAFSELIAGIGKLNTGQLGLQDGIEKLYSGSNELAGGANHLTAGMSQLTGGADKIQEGTGQLADGSKDLEDGTIKLNDGSKELADKLESGAKEAGSIHADDDTYEMMGQPVTVEKHEINKVPNYGTGFAPYFISLGLFVGALLISIVFALKKPIERPKNAFQWFISKFGIIAMVGTVQSILVDVILLLGLKIEVANIPLFFVTSIITSFVFMALIQMLVTILGEPGRFLAIIVLILQLTTSAGTFPLELIPNALQPINALLPMTYSVQSFKAVISSGDISYLWQNNGILLLYMISFMIITFSYLKLKIKIENKTVIVENKIA